MGYWAAFFILLVGGFIIELIWMRNWGRYILVSLLGAIILGATVYIDYAIQTTDTEVRSGIITSWNHKDAWDEWHPPSKTCSKDSNGKETCKTSSGYWEHHPAENYIYTTDDGWIGVQHGLYDSRQFSDSYPSSDYELSLLFPESTPTASVHTYVNKVKASYSIFRHRDIDLDEYPFLPNYPDKISNYVFIDRLIGSVPDLKATADNLIIWNSYLNTMIDDPERPGKQRSWKQVNMILVSFPPGTPQTTAFALQDKWQNGNKNDFIVTFSLNSQGKADWAYVFSWSEVETLKLEVQDLIMNAGKITAFSPILDKIGNLVAEKFVRKQFADFNYLQIEPSKWAVTTIWVLEMLCLVVYAMRLRLHFKDKARREKRKLRFEQMRREMEA